ncbi:hypothetical protein SCLCIDRAFT_1222279 [Scleroderma citrinum Foug A]|uniref:Uncharacterized protein n=1 Tax=Scleroderma citrinum Foug A TaxID=1036808 RepID=A0A0C2YWS0_9AGAM|nr:hypothetical protein SCLCIDRAFT_1222279 [Scleroderma citrinum Foug A]
MSLPYAASLATISSLVSDPKLRKPCLGIICGSGLSTLVSSLKNAVEIPYSKLEGFSNSTVTGQKSFLAFGYMGKDNNYPVVAMLGRVRLAIYEPHTSPADVCQKVSSLRRL